MKPSIKKKWVKALKSRDYKQNPGFLRRREGYSCLGVLCNLHAIETGVSWTIGKEGITSFTYLNEISVLPQVVMNWAGLTHSNPVINGRLLSTYDGDEYSFEYIASLIEERL